MKKNKKIKIMDKFIASIFGHFNLDVMAELLLPKEKRKGKKKNPPKNKKTPSQLADLKVKWYPVEYLNQLFGIALVLKNKDKEN